MVGPPTRLLDQVTRHLENEIAGDLSNDSRYFPSCRPRRFGNNRLQLSDISYIKRDENENLVVVNSRLSNAGVVFSFQCDSVDSWNIWRELLNNYTMKLGIVAHRPPYVVKWEKSGDTGVLKADEYFDSETEYVDKDIGARAAMEVGVEKLLHDYLPREEDTFDTVEVQPEKIKALFEESTQPVGKL